MPERADQMAYLPKSVGDYLVERGWATLDRNSGVYYVARVRDAQGDDGETDRQRELRTGVANTTVENYRRGLEDVNEMVFAHCRRLGIPLMSPPRVAEALDALAEAAARSPQDEDHERPVDPDITAEERRARESKMLAPSRDGTVAVEDPACSDPNCSYRAEIEMGHYVPASEQNVDGG